MLQNEPWTLHIMQKFYLLQDSNKWLIIVHLLMICQIRRPLMLCLSPSSPWGSGFYAFLTNCQCCQMKVMLSTVLLFFNLYIHITEHCSLLSHSGSTSHTLSANVSCDPRSVLSTNCWLQSNTDETTYSFLHGIRNCI